MDVLVIAAHPDDEILGCGGTIARLATEGNFVHILILADGESSRNSHQTDANITNRKHAAVEAGKITGCKTVEVLGLPDNQLDTIPLLEIVKHIEKEVERYQPSLVLTHHHGDVNIDHTITHEAVLAACRPQPGHPVKELLFFEIPSSTEWRLGCPSKAFTPNYFVDISKVTAVKKEALSAYADELRPYPHPRSFEAIETLAKYRGSTVGVAAAEAFVVGRKQI